MNRFVTALVLCLCVGFSGLAWHRAANSTPPTVAAVTMSLEEARTSTAQVITITPGTYVVSEPFVIARDYMRVNADGVTIKAAAGATINPVIIGDPSLRKRYIAVRGLIVEGGLGLKIQNVTDSHFSDIFALRSTGTGIYSFASFRNTWTNMVSKANQGTGIIFEGCTTHSISGGVSSQNAGDGIEWVKNNSGFALTSFTSEGNYGYGYRKQPGGQTYGLGFYQCYAESNKLGCVKFEWEMWALSFDGGMMQAPFFIGDGCYDGRLLTYIQGDSATDQTKVRIPAKGWIRGSRSNGPAFEANGGEYKYTIPHYAPVN